MIEREIPGWVVAAVDEWVEIEASAIKASKYHHGLKDWLSDRLNDSSRALARSLVKHAPAASDTAAGEKVAAYDGLATLALISDYVELDAPLPTGDSTWRVSVGGLDGPNDMHVGNTLAAAVAAARASLTSDAR